MFSRINLPPVVKNLVIINVLMFIATIALKNMDINLEDTLSLSYFQSSSFRPWQLLTHMFMHANLMHILFNMFTLIIFGPILEKVLGGKRFLILYLVSGLGSLLLDQGMQTWNIYQLTGQWSLNEESTRQIITIIGNDRTLVPIHMALGASGAIYGVMASFAYLFPNTELMLLFIPFPLKAKYFIPIMVALDIFQGFSKSSGDIVGHFAHVGGALFGFLLVYYWNKTNRTRFY